MKTLRLHAESVNRRHCHSEAWVCEREEPVALPHSICVNSYTMLINQLGTWRTAPLFLVVPGVFPVGRMSELRRIS